MSIFGFTSCISSGFVGIENAAFNNDNGIEGAWIAVPAPKKEGASADMMPNKIVFKKKGTKKGEYTISITPKPMEGDKEPVKPEVYDVFWEK